VPDTASRGRRQVPAKDVIALIQDLLCSDLGVLNKTFDVFVQMDLVCNQIKCDTIVEKGGCYVLVLLLKRHLERARQCINFGQVNTLSDASDENAEGIQALKILCDTLDIITKLTYEHNASADLIALAGGIEAVVQIMREVPRCAELQAYASGALCNLVYNQTGADIAMNVKVNGMETLLAALKNHPGNSQLCCNSCNALIFPIEDSPENTKLLKNMGGTTVAANIFDAWLNRDKEVRKEVGRLLKLMMNDE
jgi:hypothetical protein